MSTPGLYSTSNPAISMGSTEQANDFLESIRGSYGQMEFSLISKALTLMMEVHAQQKDRPDGTPYVMHPLQVAWSIHDSVVTKNYELVAAGLLHDTVEDQPEGVVKAGQFTFNGEDLEEQALNTIGDLFGQRVAKIVRAVTNPDFDKILEESGINANDVRYAGEKRKQYAKHVESAIQDPDVAIIKYFDFASNAFSLHLIPDIPRKTKLLKKYLPVVDLFVKRFEQTANPVNLQPDKLNENILRLKQAKIDMELQLRSMDINHKNYI